MADEPCKHWIIDGFIGMSSLLLPTSLREGSLRGQYEAKTVVIIYGLSWCQGKK
jgi:hypothetical protein